MNFTVSQSLTTEVAVIFMFKDDNVYPEGFAGIDEAIFKANHQELYFAKKSDGKYYLFAGLGEKEKITKSKYMKSIKTCGDFLEKKRFCSADFVLKEIEGVSTTENIRLMVVSIVKGLYKFDKYISQKEYSRLESVNISVQTDDISLFLAAVSEEMAVCENANFARDLVVRNADDITTDKFVEVVETWAQGQAGVKIRVFNREELEKENMNLHLAVGRSGRSQPYMIILDYESDKTLEKTAFVGKGICFDSGGYNLKPSGSIETMRMDMAGAAAVFSAFKTVVELNQKANVVCAIGLAENLIGTNAYKPGDVYVSRNGKTVEITNTDAEGRLVLADVMDYVQDVYKCTEMIDVATLTGAVTVALGSFYTGAMSNNQQFIESLIKIGNDVGEKLWQLPLDENYESMIKGKLSDIKNSTEYRQAGSITAAAFLKEFVKESVKWVHLDIAGTAWSEQLDFGVYDKKYPTGVHVRLLYYFIKNKQQPKSEC